MIDTPLVLLENDSSIRSFAHKLCASPEDADEAVQHTNLVIWKNLNSFRGLAKVTTWLFVIVKNECARLQKKMFGRDFHSESGNTNSEWDSIDNLIHTKQLNEIVISSLNQLDEVDRQIIYFRDFEGLSVNETADRLQISVGSLKTKHSRVRKKLKEILLQKNISTLL